MEAEIPKQFLTIAGKPVLMHTLEKISGYSKDISIILVLPLPFIDFWKSLCNRYDFHTEHKLVEGGDTRFQSVKNGLRHINPDSLVAIHDGVRPLVSNVTIHNVFAKAEKEGNAIPTIKVNDTIRKIEDDKNIPVNRREYRIIQTPQCFQSKLILKAYEQEYRDSFTDDASVVEALGVEINLVEGNYENIKITRPVDLKFAEAFLK